LEQNLQEPQEVRSKGVVPRPLLPNHGFAVGHLAWSSTYSQANPPSIDDGGSHGREGEGGSLRGYFCL
jgi:hypothetical protein